MINTKARSLAELKAAWAARKYEVSAENTGGDDALGAPTAIDVKISVANMPPLLFQSGGGGVVFLQARETDHLEDFWQAVSDDNEKSDVVQLCEIVEKLHEIFPGISEVAQEALDDEIESGKEEKAENARFRPVPRDVTVTFDGIVPSKSKIFYVIQWPGGITRRACIKDDEYGSAAEDEVAAYNSFLDVVFESPGDEIDRLIVEAGVKKTLTISEAVAAKRRKVSARA
jgi:hypothetical protein